MRERLNRAVSKTVVPVLGPWVRIPPSPQEDGSFLRTLFKKSRSRGDLMFRRVDSREESFFSTRRSKGEVTEWLKVHAWKACVVHATAGSNPALSAHTVVL